MWPLCAQLAHYYRRPPDQLSDEELRQYFLYLRNAKKGAEGTFRIHLYGIRFFDDRRATDAGARPQRQRGQRPLRATGPPGADVVTGVLAARRQELLPVPYVHVVFTVPRELREIIRRHQQDRYDILLRLLRAVV